MRAGAPLGLIAWQLMLTDSIRAMQRYGGQPQPLSNIELLIPLMVDDHEPSDESDESGSSSSGERYLRTRIDKDTPFSNIPSSEFVLDESENVPVEHKKKRGHKRSQKQELESLRTRPRSVYLESVASEESDELDERSEQAERGADVWRACQRLTQHQAGHQHELLLLLCAELLDAPPAPPPLVAAPPAPPHSAGCPCCQQSAPVWLSATESARRKLVGFGDDPFFVKKYMRSRERKRRFQVPPD